MILIPEMSSHYYDKMFCAGGAQKAYHLEPEKSPYAPLWQQMIAHLEPQDRIADFGCGPGQLANLIIKAGFCYTMGVDFSQQAISMARDRNPGHAHLFQVGNLYDQSIYPHQCYNTAIFCEVLEHLKKDLKVLSWLPRGIKIIFSVPNFLGVSHVRSSATAGHVYQRYSKIIKIDQIDTINISSNLFFILTGCSF